MGDEGGREKRKHHKRRHSDDEEHDSSKEREKKRMKETENAVQPTPFSPDSVQQEASRGKMDVGTLETTSESK